ncbi:MAG: pyruvate ferredoxin oxidoreductase [Candidatus Micrarchaeota archaeon]|nr:pyruvate ferredoxin oxidoreductase [Candidatus Micrarchaeota archaeon]
MTETIEGSAAVAHVVRNCEPDVVACYPITPSTHIAEDLAKMYANGEIKKYITVESEFSAISAIMGASAAGGRSFSTTSSQGLALMHEAIFAAAGLRLSPVMCVANRALSAPLNIWNDHEDTIAERDSGWLQIYCETNQETVDAIPQAFKVAESAYIPAMVCMDGFYLTHAVEQIDVPKTEMIRSYLPKFKPFARLDPENPVSIGAYAFPADYQNFREDLHRDLIASKAKVRKAHDEMAKLTGRSYGDGLLEQYRMEDADYIFMGLGSVMGTAKEAVDRMRAKGEKVGALRVRCFRPFPGEELAKALAGKKSVAVFEKDYSLGASAPMYAELVEALYQKPEAPVLSSFVGGLGGKDMTVENVESLLAKIKDAKRHSEWV